MKNLLCCVLIYFLPGLMRSQIMNSFAGNGYTGYTGDSIPATSCELNVPYGIAVNGNSAVYIADNGNSRIRMVKMSTGFIFTIAGTGISGDSGDGGLAKYAKINSPVGLNLDGNGNVYFAEEYGQRIRKIDSATKIITTVCGTGTAGGTGDGGPANLAQLNYPQDICIDTAGNIYIADFLSHKIRFINKANGIISTIAGNGTSGFSGDGGPALNAQLNGPSGVCVDSLGNVYISDSYNQRIRKVNKSTGIITTIAGTGIGSFSGDGGPAISAEISYPMGIIMLNNNLLLFAEKQDPAVRLINLSTGIIKTVAGTGNVYTGNYGNGLPATQTMLHQIADVGVDNYQNLYISETGNSDARIVTAGWMNKITSFTQEQELFSLYPNPNQGIFTLKYPITEVEGNLLLLNQLGDVLKNQELIAGQESIAINVDDLPPGIYFYSVRIGQWAKIGKVTIIK